MSDEELIESLDRHFIAGCEGLTSGQLREHEQHGHCRECRYRSATAASARVNAEAVR
jgi:hypothetical protein